MIVVSDTSPTSSRPRSERLTKFSMEFFNALLRDDASSSR
jgi:hypothetical protein